EAGRVAGPVDLGLAGGRGHRQVAGGDREGVAGVEAECVVVAGGEGAQVVGVGADAFAAGAGQATAEDAVGVAVVEGAVRVGEAGRVAGPVDLRLAVGGRDR